MQSLRLSRAQRLPGKRQVQPKKARAVCLGLTFSVMSLRDRRRGLSLSWRLEERRKERTLVTCESPFPPTPQGHSETLAPGGPPAEEQKERRCQVNMPMPS